MWLTDYVLQWISRVSCLIYNFAPVAYEYKDPKKEVLRERPVSTVSWLLGYWQNEVSKISEDTDVHIVYKFNNKRFVYVLKKDARFQWPPFTVLSDTDPKGVVMAVLVSTDTGVREVTSDLTAFLGPNYDFHGMQLTPADMFHDMHPHGIFCVATFDHPGLVFKCHDTVRL